MDVAGDTVQQALGKSIVGCSRFLSGSLEQLKDDLYSPDDSQDERSKGNRSQVVSPDPVVAERDVSISVLLLTVPGEEPGRGSYDDNELRAGHEEAEDPDEGKDHEASLSNSLIAVSDVLGLKLVARGTDITLRED